MHPGQCSDERSQSGSSNSVRSKKRIRDLVRSYRSHCRIHCLAHDKTARLLKRRNSVLDTPQKILPFITTTLLAPYATDGSAPNHAVTMLALANTCITGTLAILRDSLGYGKASVSHRNANLAYSQLYRDIMHFMARSHTDAEVDNYVTLLEQRVNDLDEHSPTIPRALMQKARAELDRCENNGNRERAEGVCELYLSTYGSPKAKSEHKVAHRAIGAIGARAVATGSPARSEVDPQYYLRDDFEHIIDENGDFILGVARF